MSSEPTNHHRPEATLPNLPDMQAWDDQQDQLDRLNDLWDSLATDDRRQRPQRTWNPIRLARSRHTDPEAAAQAQTIRALDRAASTPDPDTQFLRDLRSALMDTSRAVPIGVFDQSPSTPSPGGFAPPRSITPIRPSVLKRFSGTSMRILELAAVAALLLTMIGFAAGNRGIQDIRALLPASQDETADLDSVSYLGNAAHTGEMPGPGPKGPVGLLWRTPDTNNHPMTPDSSPVVADGVVYLTTRSPDRDTGETITAMAAIDLQTGLPIWTAPLPGLLTDAAVGAPAVAHEVVYIGVTTDFRSATPSRDALKSGAVVALDAQTGKELWAFEESKLFGASSPVVTDGTLYIVADDGTLYALDAETGNLLWSTFPTDEEPGSYPAGFATAPTVSADTVYVPTARGTLYALDRADGTERWTASIGDLIPTMATVTDDTVFIGAISYPRFAEQPVNEPATPEINPSGENVLAFDAATGERRWAFDTPGLIGGAPTVAGDLVLVTGQGDTSTDIVAVSTADGSEQWRTATGSAVITPAVWSNDTVYVGSSDSKLYALDLATGEVQWQVATGDAILTTPVVADGIVAFTSADGHLYGLSTIPQNGMTPTATAERALDISGMPACTIAPRFEFSSGAPTGMLLSPEGTPTTQSVRPDYEARESIGDNGMLFADLPTGDPAPQDALNAIEATITEIAACNRPGYEARLARYFSDDYFRRNPVTVTVGAPGYPPLRAPDYLASPAESTMVLPDGRIAVLYTYEVPTPTALSSEDIAEHGNLVVWVQEDGRWLIDELLQVAETPGRG